MDTNVAIFPLGNNLLHNPLRTASLRQNSSSPGRIKLSSLVGSKRRSGLEFLDTNSIIRSLVADLLADGLNQVTMAKHMGLSRTWFNRWLNHKDDRVLTVDAVTGLLAFLRAFGHTIDVTVYGVEQALIKADAAPRTGNGKRGVQK